VALIRYPGSKEKLIPDMIRRFPDDMHYELWAASKKWEYSRIASERIKNVPFSRHVSVPRG
jgi:hypothetical protein